MKKLFTIILVAVASTMYAQFTLDGEIRPRVEFDHGYKTPQAKETMFSLATSQRTRLGFGYKSDLFDVGIQVQDVRFWGEEKQLVVNDGAHTTIHQAWASIKFTELLSLKVGRQELVYDDSRILGNVGWAQQARSHDLALFKFEKKDAFKLHAGFAVNQVQTDAYAVANYKSMQFLWFNKSFGDAYTLSVLALNNGAQDSLINGVGNTTTYSQIVGQRSVYKTGKLTVGLNFYYQMGYTTSKYMDDSGDFQKQKLGAYNLGLDLNYKLNDNIGIGGGYEMLSGNSQTETDATYSQTNHAFTPLYGTNHKFNGWMDYFYVNNHKNTVGLNDAYVKVSYKKDKFLSGAHFHYFMANQEVKDVENSTATDIKAMSSGLGTEIDLYAGYKMGKGVTLKAGLSMMFASETMHAIKLDPATGNPAVAYDDAGTNYWGWMMIVIKPTFFTSEKK